MSEQDVVTKANNERQSQITEPDALALERLNLEQRRLELEIECRREELRLRSAELELRREEELRKNALETKGIGRFVPLIAVFVSALVGIVGSGMILLQALLNRDLERRKFEASVVLEAIKTGDPDQAAENLEFLVTSGLLQDEKGQLRRYLERRVAGQGRALPPP